MTDTYICGIRVEVRYDPQAAVTAIVPLRPLTVPLKRMIRDWLTHTGNVLVDDEFTVSGRLTPQTQPSRRIPS